MYYEVFGDVLAFGGTYHEQIFMSFWIFFRCQPSQSNNSFCNCSCGKWDGRNLCVVVGAIYRCYEREAFDLAMKNAIMWGFANARHWLCAWHLLCNANSNVGIFEMMPFTVEEMHVWWLWSWYIWRVVG